MKEIKIVTIIGANGTMGYNVSGIFSAFGNTKTYMICRKIEDAQNAVEMAAKSVKADAIKEKLIPKTYEDMEECLKESDFIFESVSEKLDIKNRINKLINKFAKEDAIIATGTSGLSINELSKEFSSLLKTRYIGVHFFNPPYSMTLCEVIPSIFTNKILVKELKEYLKKVLFRKTVEIKDSPAFLGNRIGFYFINEALIYAEKLKDNGGIDYIDSILGPFTGRNMPPIKTADFVGLDVHKAIVENIRLNINDKFNNSFIVPDYVQSLINAGNIGKKMGKGLYTTIKNADGKKNELVYDINTKSYIDKTSYRFPFSTGMINAFSKGNYEEGMAILVNNFSPEAKLCLEFLLKYIVYSIKIANDIGEDIHSADDVMVAGFNWIPPLALIDALGGKKQVLELIKQRLSAEMLADIAIEKEFNIIENSKYDFRTFLKAKL